MLLACDSLDDESGYLISEEGRVIRVLLWVKDKPTKQMDYFTYEYMRQQAIQNATSSVKDYSDFHRVQAIMYEAFLAQDDRAPTLASTTSMSG